VSPDAPHKLFAGNQIVKSVLVVAKYVGFVIVVLELWHLLTTGEWEWKP
jgi:hypothetical protein